MMALRLNLFRFLRINKVCFLFILLATSMSGIVSANSITGTIKTLHVNSQSNRAHITLDNSPLFDGNGCASVWSSNSLDDMKFRQYIYPLLLTAKATAQPITIYVNGCDAGDPIIDGVDYSPR